MKTMIETGGRCSRPIAVLCLNPVIVPGSGEAVKEEYARKLKPRVGPAVKPDQHHSPTLIHSNPP
jgi:hypothetical protein